MKSLPLILFAVGILALSSRAAATDRFYRVKVIMLLQP